MRECQHEVEQMITDRKPFGEIEDHIEGMSVDRDTKAALWLLAWSEQQLPRRRRVIEDALTVAAAPQG